MARRSISSLGFVILLAAALSGCMSAGSPPSTSPSDGPDTPATDVDEAFTHSYLDAAGEQEFEVSTLGNATVDLWFEGVFGGGGSLVIQLISPDEEVVAETRSPEGFIGGAAGGRSYPVSTEVTLSPGIWTVAFSGTGAPTGSAVIQSI